MKIQGKIKRIKDHRYRSEGGLGEPVVFGNGIYGIWKTKIKKKEKEGDVKCLI